MKILNLYAGIGGNRKAMGHTVVCYLRIDGDIVAVYPTVLSDNTVIVGDAPSSLLTHHQRVLILFGLAHLAHSTQLQTIF